MDRRFYEAWFNASHTVLGRKLHPFCLEDALILSLAESPFLLGLTSGVTYSLEDLQEAVTICSTPGDRFLSARFTSTRLSRLRRAWWTTQCRRLDLKTECQRFVTYLDDYNSPPDVWKEEDGGEGRLRAPWVLGHSVFMMRHTTFPERAIWTMPLGKLLWYCATLSEQLGEKVQIVSEEEQEAMEALGI